jgi:hypothetical protein
MKHERHIFDTAPPRLGLQKSLSSLTPLTHGKIRLVCPICTNDFVRPVAWAKRVNVNYCCKGCANVGKMVRVDKPCANCGNVMNLTPTEAGRITTCGPVCSSEWKRKPGNTAKTRSWAASRKVIAEVSRRGVCSCCGRPYGPWVVRGLRMFVAPGVLPMVDSEQSTLWCQTCHLSDIAHSGGVAVQTKKQSQACTP